MELPKRKISIIRMTSDTLLVGGVVCQKYNGVYCPIFKEKLSRDKINAIFDFLQNEKRKWEAQAERAVAELLRELNFNYKLN